MMSTCKKACFILIYLDRAYLGANRDTGLPELEHIQICFWHTLKDIFESHKTSFKFTRYNMKYILRSKNPTGVFFWSFLRDN